MDVSTPVQGLDEMLLEATLHSQHQEVHDCLWHRILRVDVHSKCFSPPVFDRPNGDGGMQEKFARYSAPSWNPHTIFTTKEH